MTNGFQRSSESRYEAGKRERAAAFLEEIQGMIDCEFHAAVCGSLLFCFLILIKSGTWFWMCSGVRVR